MCCQRKHEEIQGEQSNFRNVRYGVKLMHDIVSSFSRMPVQFTQPPHGWIDDDK